MNIFTVGEFRMENGYREGIKIPQGRKVPTYCRFFS